MAKTRACVHPKKYLRVIAFATAVDGVGGKHVFLLEQCDKCHDGGRWTEIIPTRHNAMTCEYEKVKSDVL